MLSSSTSFMILCVPHFLCQHLLILPNLSPRCLSANPPERLFSYWSTINLSRCKLLLSFLRISVLSIFHSFTWSLIDKERSVLRPGSNSIRGNLFACYPTALCVPTRDKACGTTAILETYANTPVSNAIFRVSNNFPPVLSKFATIN